jgi:signal transduction histidine kinase
VRVTKRLLATYVTLTIVVLAALEIPLGIQYGRSERRDLTNGIVRDALVMATFAEDPLERGLSTPSVQLSTAARNYATDPGGRVVVVNGRAVSILDTESAPGRSFASRPEFAAALATHPTIATGSRHSNTLGTDLIYAAVPITAPGGSRLGALRITYPTSALDSRVTRYWLLLAAIGGVVLAAATAVGLRFARTLARPLSALEHAAAAVGAGDLTARAPARSGPPEVRAVAARFNETVEQLDGLLHSQQEFVADASHQLRTPLTALRLRLENLERDVAAGAQRDLEAALAEVERLARLVDGLLVLARADATKPAPEPVDLAAVASGRVEHWSLQAAERKVELAADLPAGLHGLATPGALEQVLDNLLSNALAVSPPGSTIRIAGRDAGERVELRVTDEGSGMTAEQRARAFDRFWRAGPSSTGTGLGLAVVHRLVTADGGQVELRESPGGGLEAVISLRAVPRVGPNPYLRLART